MIKKLLLFLALATGAAFAQGQFGGGGGAGGGSGTVGNCAGAGIAVYTGAGTSITCDTGIVDSGPGNSLVVPNGTTTLGGLSFATAGMGLTELSSTVLCVTNATNCKFGFYGTTVAIATGSGGGFGIQSSANVSSSNTTDTGWHRAAAGVAAFDTDAALSNGLGTIKSGGNNAQQTASNFTTTNTTATTWKTVTLPAVALSWSFHCNIAYQESVTTAGMVLGIISSVSPTSEFAQARIYTTATGTSTDGSVTATTNLSQTVLTGANVGTANATFQATLDGVIEVASGGSSFSIQAWNSSAATLTILRGSYCRFW